MILTVLGYVTGHGNVSGPVLVTDRHPHRRKGLGLGSRRTEFRYLLSISLTQSPSSSQSLAVPLNPDLLLLRFRLCRVSAQNCQLPPAVQERFPPLLMLTFGGWSQWGLSERQVHSSLPLAAGQLASPRRVSDRQRPTVLSPRAASHPDEHASTAFVIPTSNQEHTVSPSNIRSIFRMLATHDMVKYGVQQMPSNRSDQDFSTPRGASAARQFLMG